MLDSSSPGHGTEGSGTLGVPRQERGLAKGLVKPKKTLKQHFGWKVCVGVAISAKKVWTCYIPKKNWPGAAARELDSGHLGLALKKEHPVQAPVSPRRRQ